MIDLKDDSLDDLDYSDELHGLYSDYPLASEKVKVSKDMLSEFKLQILSLNFVLLKTKNLFIV